MTGLLCHDVMTRVGMITVLCKKIGPRKSEPTSCMSDFWGAAITQAIKDAHLSCVFPSSLHLDSFGLGSSSICSFIIDFVLKSLSETEHISLGLDMLSQRSVKAGSGAT